MTTEEIQKEEDVAKLQARLKSKEVRKKERRLIKRQIDRIQEVQKLPVKRGD